VRLDLVSHDRSIAVSRFASAVLAGKIGDLDALHPVALENPAAGDRQSAAILLQALLHGRVVAEVLSAKMIGVPRAGALLLRRAGVLCQRG
jgi:hypothetical protein